MLDMHRVSSNQLNIQRTFVDLKRDILEPVASMLYRRGACFDVIVDCPSESLIIETDPLRLKQIILNLGRNSAKFIEQGFVRFRTAIVDESVRIYCEDSGPGVPIEKQDNLFGRFQESLDVLNQGTGIGLALCKDLTELLGGRIWIDREYDSGIPNSRGACFVVDLRTPPIDDDSSEVEDTIHIREESDTTASSVSPTPVTSTEQEQRPAIRALSTRRLENEELPPGVSVLFVDDDFTLRKLFVRAVSRVTEDWKIDQASNGETAVSIVASNAVKRNY
jgi:hypothetical protein